MVSRRLMRPMLVTVALLVGIGASKAAAQDECLALLPTDRVTLNLRDASTQTTLRLLAQQYRVNMVVTDDVKGTVALDFFKVPAREVFRSIIEAGRLRCVVTGDVLRVSTDTRVKADEAERNKVQEAQLRLEADTRLKIVEARQKESEAAELAARGPVREEIIRLHYADAEQVARTIQGILGLPVSTGGFSAPVALPQLSQLYVPSPPVNIPSEPPPPQTAPVPPPTQSAEAVAKGLTVGFYKATNSIFIRYYANDLERIKKLIQESLDVPVPQIQIAAQMVITTLNALDQIGVQWGGGKATAVNNGAVVVGQGFATPNFGGTPITTVPPPAAAGSIVSPATIGNLVNLPTLLLPTVAGPAGGLLLGLIGQNFNISLAIQALEVQSKARTLAEPKIVTLENVKGTISRGFEVPFVSTPTTGVSQVQFKDALLSLEVTPRLVREDGERKIGMKVVFNNDIPDFTQTVQGNPSIFKRRQETTVLVREGQRLVFGGVTNDARNSQTRQVPVLGNVPVLGWLFRSRETTSAGEEMIVILTPTVLSEPGAPPRR